MALAPILMFTSPAVSLFPTGDRILYGIRSSQQLLYHGVGNDYTDVVCLQSANSVADQQSVDLLIWLLDIRCNGLTTRLARQKRVRQDVMAIMMNMSL